MAQAIASAIPATMSSAFAFILSSTSAGVDDVVEQGALRCPVHFSLVLWFAGKVTGNPTCH